MISAFAPYDSSSDDDVPVVVSSTGALKSQNLSNVSGSRSDSFKGLPVPGSRVLLVLNQLAVMTQNGVELAEALASVTTNCIDKRLASSLEKIYHAVSSGSTFSGAIATYGHFFPDTLAPMIAAAEETGEIPSTLAKVSVRMRGELEMRGTIIGALIYPVILIGASAVVMSALVIGVLPQFSKVFTSMGRPVPATTQYLLSFGDLCRANWFWIIPCIVGGMIALFCLRKHDWIRRPIGWLLMYGPMIRNAYRPLVAGRTFRTIASMVRGGVPLLQSVRLARKATADHYWQSLLVNVETNLIDGLTASNAMGDYDFLPPEATQMMATGERTGRVGEVLEDIGSFYEQEGGRKIKRLVVAFEPIIILCMGVVVAGIVMSVMLPLLDVSTVGR